MILWGAAGFLVLLLAALLGGVAWRLRSARASGTRAQARLAALLECYEAGLAVWDAGGRLVACNGRFREFYPAVTLEPGLEFEDLVRYTATRAVVLVPEAEMEEWIAQRLERREEAVTETLRTPDGRWIEMRSRPTDQGETLLVYAEATAEGIVSAGETASETHEAGRAAVLRLLEDAMAVGRQAVSFHQAVRDLVRLLAEWGGWDAGTAYLAPSDGSGTLVSTGVWHVADAQVAPLEMRAALDACCDDRNDHVLRRAVSSAESTWIANVAVDPRVSDARRDALGDFRSICAVPVVSGGRVVAVVETFAAEPTVPDPARERLVAGVVGELAHVFERERAALTSGTAHGAGGPGGSWRQESAPQNATE